MNGTRASHAEAVFEPPAPLGSYMLLTKLARGGMATVYVGSKLGVAGFERLVAVKCCHPDLREDEEFVAMFFDEARLAARIHHPNVVPTLDVGCTDVLYLVMDYVEGDSLKGLLRRARERGALLPIDVVLRVMIDALMGLHAAHELCGNDGELLNLVHRDVSPQNILIGVDGISRITDFGIVFAASRSSKTPDGKLLGKLSYMSPEQVKGEEATRRIDVFAAGIVLWEALTGQPLFRRKDDAATINAVLGAEIVAPSLITPSIPAALDNLVLKALQRHPDDRFQTAAEFADALEQLPIEAATSRTIAAYIEEVIGPRLAERRGRIREASEQGEQLFETESVNSVVRWKELLGAPGDSSGSSFPPSWRSGARPHEGLVPSVAPSTALEGPSPTIEHWRMRGLLAAAMLLLVGSAVGLLLARSSAEPARAPATPPNLAPNPSDSAQSVQTTKPAQAPSR